MISSSQNNGVLVISINNKFTIDQFKEFQEAYYNDLELDSIIIDFSKTTHIDSGGLGMLLQMRTQLGDKANIIKLKSPSDTIKSIFNVVNFEKIFQIT